MKTICLAFVCVALISSSSSAEPPASGEPAAAASTDAAASLTGFREVLGAAGCSAEAIADPRFIADAKNELRPIIHQEDSSATVTNKRHVVMAYAALLGLLVVFVLMIGMRLRRLMREVERLEEELGRVIEEGA